MELKTLKDFDSILARDIVNGNIVSTIDLREELIKWIKELKKPIKREKADLPEEFDRNVNSHLTDTQYYEGLFNMIQLIKYIGNIKDEDLK